MRAAPPGRELLHANTLSRLGARPLGTRAVLSNGKIFRLGPRGFVERRLSLSLGRLSPNAEFSRGAPAGSPLSHRSSLAPSAPERGDKSASGRLVDLDAWAGDMKCERTRVAEAWPRLRHRRSVPSTGRRHAKPRRDVCRRRADACVLGVPIRGLPLSSESRPQNFFHGPQNPCPVALSDVPCGDGAIGATGAAALRFGGRVPGFSRSQRASQAHEPTWARRFECRKRGGIEGQDYHLFRLRRAPAMVHTVKAV